MEMQPSVPRWYLLIARASSWWWSVLLSWCSRRWGMTAALRPFTNFIGWMQLRRLTTSLLSWSTSVDRELYRRTLQMFCLVIVSSYLLYTIINRWWPRFFDCWFVSGTVYRSTSHLCSHCQSSTVALRHISSGAVSRDYFVVSEKWHCHIRAH